MCWASVHRNAVTRRVGGPRRALHRRVYGHTASEKELPAPKQYAKTKRPHHLFLDDYARTLDHDTHFKTAADVKRAVAARWEKVVKDSGAKVD